MRVPDQNIIVEEEDRSSPWSWYQPELTVLAAIGVLALGTAWVDLARVPLLLVPASLLVTVYGAGALVERAIGGLASVPDQGTDYPKMSLVAIHLGVGLAAFSFLVTIAAFLHAFWIAGVAAIPALAYGLRETVRVLSSLRFERRGLPSMLAGTVVGGAWLVAWLWATIPPTFFDELSYHLVVPQLALLTGGLPDTPWVFFTLMPHASDVLLAWGMAFEGELGARAGHAGVWMACALAAWGLAEAIAWPKAALLAGPLTAAALAASPTLWFVATLPFAGATLSLALITAMVILAAPVTDRRPWIAFGLALGLAGTVKLTGIYFIGAGLVAAAVARWPVRDLAKAACLVLVSLAPWWARALVYTGNPIYPMGYELLGGRPWSPESQARAFGDVSYRLVDFDLIGLLRLPVDLVRYPERFGSGSDLGILALVATCALLIWPALSRLTGMDRRQQRLSDMLAAFVLVAGAGWVFTTTITRFLSPALVIGLAVLAGVCLYLGRTGQVVALVLLLAAGSWGGWRFITQHEAAFSSYEVALGRERANVYLARQLDHFASAGFVRDNLPADARLLFIGETRPYYFFRTSLAPTAYDRHPLRRWVEESSSPEMLVSRLTSEGITHVVLNVREFRRLREGYGILSFSGEDADVHESRLKQLPEALEQLFSENGVYVFKVPRALDARQGGPSIHLEGPAHQTFAPRATWEERLTTHPLKGERR